MSGNMVRCVYAVCVLFAGLVSLAAGQDKNVAPGDTLLVTASPDLSDKESVTVDVEVSDASSTCDHPNIPGTAVFELGKHGFTIAIPSDMCTGQYKISAKHKNPSSTPPPGGASSTPPGTGDVNSSMSDLVIAPQLINVQPVVTAIDPKAVYGDGATTISFLGPPSLKYNKDNKSYNNYGIAFQDHALIRCVDGQSDTKNCFKLCEDSQNGQISFKVGDACLRGLSGKQSVYLTHNGAKSDGQAITIVPVSKNTPRNSALAVTAGLIALVYLLLSAGRRGLQGTKRGFLLSALFLDEETQTYSLSKCQFYAWTLAATLGYVFLAISTSLVQGNAVFPDVPEGLPGIILASAGTAVLATGITSSKGSKGAGLVHPSLADFVTNGGVVAAERLQFVVWTVVGIVTFLTIVLNSNPLTVNTLPKIPDRFLELMGISSAGYLGGKLARKAGPVIKVISVARVGDPVDRPENDPNRKIEPPVLTLHLQGQNLDPKASVKVDGGALRGDLFWIRGTPNPQTGFCSDLFVSLSNAAPYIKDSHTLTLVNSDSQSADVVFPIDPMKIETVSDPDASGKATVTGKNFADPTKYQWLDAQGKDLPVDPKNPNAQQQATVQSVSSLTVVRPKEVTAGYKLVLTSLIGLKAEKTI